MTVGHIDWVNNRMTLDRARRILHDQNWACAICHESFHSRPSDKGDRVIVVDRDYNGCCGYEKRFSCGRCIRGYLCRDCSSRLLATDALVSVGRDDWSDRAAAYLAGASAAAEARVAAEIAAAAAAPSYWDAPRRIGPRERQFINALDWLGTAVLVAVIGIPLFLFYAVMAVVGVLSAVGLTIEVLHLDPSFS
jgi:hypothetical protein